MVTYRALDAAPLVFAGGGVVARQRGRDAAAAAEDGAAVAHVGDEELAVLYQSRRRACATANALYNTGVPIISNYPMKNRSCYCYYFF
jgi:hypothetical protein